MDIAELNNIINKINKGFGKQVIQEAEGFESTRVPTGSFSLDTALRGGWPMGRICVLWGNRSSTKTTLSLWTIANAQKQGLRCLFIDAEKGFDSAWAQRHGVDVKSLMIARVNTLEAILAICAPLLKEKAIDVVVIDSINAINAEKFFDDNNHTIGLHARTIAEMLTKLNKWMDDELIILISQTRTKMQANYTYTEYSGGLAMDFFPSVIVKTFQSRDPETIISRDIQNNGKIIKQEIGRRIRWEITKSRVCPAGITGSYIFYHNGGVDWLDEVLTLGIARGVIPQAGSWITWGDEKFQGVAAFKEFLADHAEVAEEVRNGILEGSFE